MASVSQNLSLLSSLHQSLVNTGSNYLYQIDTRLPCNGPSVPSCFSCCCEELASYGKRRQNPAHMIFFFYINLYHKYGIQIRNDFFYLKFDIVNVNFRHVSIGKSCPPWKLCSLFLCMGAD